MTAKPCAAISSLLLLALITPALGHPVPRQSTRELIRIQGYRTDAQPTATQKSLVLVALGTEHPFVAAEWKIFALAEGAKDDFTLPTQQRFSLQGSREELMRFAAARADQQITLLADHRPGSSDLFILSLDLCPQQ